MAQSAILEGPPSHGFDFSNHARNQFLGARLGGLPTGTFFTIPERVRASKLMSEATSTGTTIVGVKFGGGSSGEEEGVCLGADTRATGGSIVADKNCEKVS
jgi:20S proteasome subunit beta 2